jgi:two-component system, cell cycle response regulator
MKLPRTFDFSSVRDYLWTRPDPVLVEEGASGELLVARIRLLLTGVLLLIPVVNFALLTGSWESLVGLWVTVAAFLISSAVYALAALDFRRHWLGFASASLDVTLVSGALATFLAFDQPHTAVNSKVIFEGYFLAIGATCLRYDARVCVLAGALALAQYAGIVTYAASRWDLNGEAYAPFPYGMFSWTAQISRLILLLTASLLTLAVVARARQLRRLSTSDRLTGLFNRGYFNERMATELARASRSGLPLVVAMIDVDHFKRFNDAYGHAAGDAALQLLAAHLKQSFRRSDIVARYGGEEFVVVMPETDAASAAKRLESLRREVEKARVQVTRKRRKPARVTISAGLASYPEDGGREEELIAAADERLFEAKRLGRNQIVGRERRAGSAS